MTGAAAWRAMLRPGEPKDVDLLVRHRRRMWEDIGGHEESALDAADTPYRAWLEARLRDGTLAAFITEELSVGAVASGCVWLQPVQPRPNYPGEAMPYLLSMYTEPAHRGRGHAEAIVRAAMAWARERGYPRMSLHASLQGRRIYERLGFATTGEMRVNLAP